MKIFSLIAVLMMCSLSVQASEEAFLYVPDHGGLQPARDAFYSQPPMWAGINASDGYDTEIADDIPLLLGWSELRRGHLLRRSMVERLDRPVWIGHRHLF